MATWIPWLLLVAVTPASAATWSYRVPVPTEAPADGKGFQLCLDLPAELGMKAATLTGPGVTVHCEPQEESTKVCYRVGDPWPERFEPLTCVGERINIELRFVPAFDPTDDPLDGLTIVATDEVAASFALPPGSWIDAAFDGPRGTVCRVSDGRLWVWRDGRSRRPGLCEIRDRSGKPHRFTIRFGSLR